MSSIEGNCVSSAECGILCVGIRDIQSRLARTMPHEQRQLSKELSYGIASAVLGVEGRSLWVDSGEAGREIVLFERAVDGIKAAEEITHCSEIDCSDGDLELQVGVHWGRVTWDSRNLKVFGEGIQDVKALEREATERRPNISQQCVEAAQQQSTCKELANRCWIFISYSRADNKRPNFLEELLQQTRPFEVSGRLGVFVDTRIRPSDRWFRAIMAGLAHHKLAILLIGPGFFASDFIMKEELPHIEQAHSQRKTEVLWVYLIEAAFLSSSWVKDVQAAHEPAMPLRKSGKLARNVAWEQVVNKITELTTMSESTPVEPDPNLVGRGPMAVGRT
ncbi:MAG: toll/interleukin-1 receptor domain-containing protein [Pyrinomonadaceae bacterium]|nr:toll/interleukin-1 receptor domain-containing protein [Pyrinomonadaceae bacterium]